MNKQHLAILGTLILTGCATQQPPEVLSAVNRMVNSRVEYVNYKSPAKRPSFHHVLDGKGNCWDIAFTKWVEVDKAAPQKFRDRQIQTCRLPDGRGHAYLRVTHDGIAWALDNRYAWVLPVSEEDCQ